MQRKQQAPVPGVAPLEPVRKTLPAQGPQRFVRWLNCLRSRHLNLHLGAYHDGCDGDDVCDLGRSYRCRLQALADLRDRLTGVGHVRFHEARTQCQDVGLARRAAPGSNPFPARWPLGCLALHSERLLQRLDAYRLRHGGVDPDRVGCDHPSVALRLARRLVPDLCLDARRRARGGGWCRLTQLNPHQCLDERRYDALDDDHDFDLRDCHCRDCPDHGGHGRHARR